MVPVFLLIVMRLWRTHFLQFKDAMHSIILVGFGNLGVDREDFTICPYQMRELRERGQNITQLTDSKSAFKLVF